MSRSEQPERARGHAAVAPADDHAERPDPDPEPEPAQHVPAQHVPAGPADRAAPARPRVERVGRAPRQPRALVLVLHGGRSQSRARTHRYQLTYARMWPFARLLARRGRHAGLAVWMLRYRYRGWNGASMDAKHDAHWALDEARHRHPDVPVVLLGHSMGARAALHVAGHPAVRAVCALAPWLDGTDPTEQLSGRAVLIAHGTRDITTDPDQSHAFAVRAGASTRVCRFEVPGDGHAMLRRPRAWSWLVRRFVLGELGIETPDGLITAALDRPAPAGLAEPAPGRRP